MGPLTISDFPVYNGQADLARMQVLYDKSFGTGSAAAGNDFNQIVNFKHSFKTGKVPHMNVRYVTGESTNAAQENGVYLYVIGSTATTSSCNGQMKAHFYDTD